MATSSSNQLKEATAKAICYVPFIGFIASIVLFLTDTRKAVKWHAVQSVVLNVGGGIVSMVIPFLGALLALGLLVLNCVIAYKLYSGEDFKLPIIKDIADNVVK